MGVALPGLCASWALRFPGVAFYFWAFLFLDPRSWALVLGTLAPGVLVLGVTGTRSFGMAGSFNTISWQESKREGLAKAEDILLSERDGGNRAG